jgi:hypothetical protein
MGVRTRLRVELKETSRPLAWLEGLLIERRAGIWTPLMAFANLTTPLEPIR